MVSENVYSIDINSKEGTTVVANRYRCETQEDMDFLILNGRVGRWFR